MRALLVLMIAVSSCAQSAPEPIPDPADPAAADDINDGEGAVPEPPPELTRWLTGDPADAMISPLGPGLFLAGGGADVEAGFSWASQLGGGGDVVILRASGADGYNEYLFEDIGGFDSVETLLVDDEALADSDYVAYQLARAEIIFIAGGDQSKYLELWSGTALQEALEQAWSRGAVLGGTSAGCAIMGELIFSAANGTVYSDEALEDPFNQYMTFERSFVSIPIMAGVITDTHFAARDRMGRLLAFLARVKQLDGVDRAFGLGIDEGTAVLISASGTAEVIGSGHVYVLATDVPADDCSPGVPLNWQSVAYDRFEVGDSFVLPLDPGDLKGTLEATTGTLSPTDPY